MRNQIVTLLIAIVVLAGCVQKEHQKTITFKVDMTDVENPKNVGIKGDFTNPIWQKTIPLTDDDNDGIYQVTLTQETAVYGIEFKFVNQNDDYELKGKNNREIVFEYKPENIVYNAVFNEEKSEIKRN